MFKQAVIYYPSDPKILGEIHKEVAALHGVAVINYLEKLGLDDRNKMTVIDSILNDLANSEKTSA